MPFNLRVARLLPLALTLIGSTALAATVTVSPSGNHPQGTTQVSGTGFGASEPVDIYFDTTDEVVAIADASGNFGPDNISIPATALPGTHSISAVGRRTAAEAQHSFRVRTNWDSHGFDAVGRRRNPYENVIDASNVGTLALKWSVTTGGAVFASPAVAQITDAYNPFVFVASEDGTLYAIDSRGYHVWKKATGGALNSSPAVSGNNVYVGSADGKLYAFHAKDGSPAWPAPATTGGIIASSPAVANGIVYVGSNDDKLYAFHASDGTPAWTPDATGGSISKSSPAVSNGIVYVGSSDTEMYAINATTGKGIWTYGASGGILSSPAVANGVVYFGSQDSYVYGVNAATGERGTAWKMQTGKAVSSSPAIANNVLYIGSTDGKFYAVPLSGARGWTASLPGGASYTSAAVANGVVYIGGGSNIYAFNAGGCGATTCSPLWSAATGGEINSSPAVANGVVYVGSSDGKIYAYALNGGHTPAYTFRDRARPPSRASLHPDLRLKPARH